MKKYICSGLAIAGMLTILTCPVMAEDSEEAKDPDSRKLATLVEDNNIGTVELHYFDAKENDAGDEVAGEGLGLKYDIKLEDNFGDELDFSKDHNFFSYSFTAEGTKAADSDKNKHDYAKNALAVKWNFIENLDQKAGEGCLEDPDEPTDPDCYLELEQYFLAFSLQASDESTQADDSYAKAYGATFDFIFHPHSASDAAKYNIFDWPFKLIRKATNYYSDGGEYFAFPKLHLAYEYVDPSKDEARKAVAPDLEGYDRMHAELAFVSVVGAIDERDLRFSASWRLWQEMNADDVIKDARLDRFIYRVYTLSLDGGFMLSYTSGRLPFDRQDDAVWSLGYKLHW